MKLSKSVLLSLVMGVVVIGAIMVYMISSQQAQQRQELSKKLFTAQQKLAQVKIDDLITQKNQLLQNKEVYLAQTAAAKTILADPIDNIAATDALLQSAREFSLRIVSINSSSKSDSTFAGSKFAALSFNVQVEGNIADIADFVNNIRIIFPTSAVETYQFAIGTPAAASPQIVSTPEPIRPIDTIATINIIIYDYKGDANVE